MVTRRVRQGLDRSGATGRRARHVLWTIIRPARPSQLDEVWLLTSAEAFHMVVPRPDWPSDQHQRWPARPAAGNHLAGSPWRASASQGPTQGAGVRTEASARADTRMMAIVHSALRSELTRAADALSRRPAPGEAQRVAIAQHLQAMMSLLANYRIGQLAAATTETAPPPADAARVFTDVPADSLHNGNRYFEHVLRGLRRTPPAYLLDIVNGAEPPAWLAGQVAGVGVVQVRPARRGSVALGWSGRYRTAAAAGRRARQRP
jgi:hypothetical protein